MDRRSYACNNGSVRGCSHQEIFKPQIENEPGRMVNKNKRSIIAGISLRMDSTFTNNNQDTEYRLY